MMRLFANENGDAGLADGRFDGLSAIVMLACVLVAPTARVLRQVGAPLSDAWFCNRTDEQVGTKHILVLLAQGLGIIGKVEHQGAHQRVALGRDALGALLDVRL